MRLIQHVKYDHLTSKTHRILDPGARRTGENALSVTEAQNPLAFPAISTIIEGEWRAVNELLRGERLDMEDYKKMAEENLMALRRQEEEANRKLLGLEWVIGILSVLSYLLCFCAGVYAVSSRLWKGLLMGGGTVLLLTGVSFALKIEQSAGYYECPKCGHRYVPSLSAVFLAPHFGRTRWMRCPCCGKRSFQKKVLTKEGA
jgi:DNA-directed RNA polymerase subunit RPC12/RpoP